MSKVSLKEIREGLKENVTLFFVHASWCPYTIQFYPIFEKVMKNLKAKGLDTKFKTIKLDDVMIKSLRANYTDIYKKIADYDENIDEYKLYFPTVVVFVNGKRYKYNASVRTVQNFEEFISNKLSKPSRKGTRRTTTKIERNENKPNKKVSMRPVKLTLQEQIDKAFQKLFK